jgi:hypothetical protein
MNKFGDGKCAELDRLHGVQDNRPENYMVFVVERTVLTDVFVESRRECKMTCC